MWNQKVRSMYADLGFETIGTKEYDNRKDVVMRYKPVNNA
jgi:hypothetical protein